MNLVIDVGNTFAKLALFEDDELLRQWSVDHENLVVQLVEVHSDFPKIDKSMIASVGRLEEEMILFIKENFNPKVLDADSKLPFENRYESPKTLGVDRLALASAAIARYPNNNVLVIDAGTCITYDFINAEGQYLGGAISPGIRLRYKSLNDYTSNLPLLETEMPTDIIGNTTHASIHSGVVYGVVNEMDGSIGNYRSKYEDLTVILTGGDAKFLSKQLKNGIFANSNFLLEGLNFLLEYNSDQCSKNFQ